MGALTFRAGSRADRAAVRELLVGLSPQSAYARFQTALGPEPPTAVVEALLPDGVHGGSVLAWDDVRLVAHGEWVRLGPGSVAEVALLVADSHQGRGLGTAVAEQVVAAAGARGVRAVEMVTGSGNVAIHRMVRHLGTHVVKRRDGATVTYSFRLPSRSGSHLAA